VNSLARQAALKSLQADEELQIRILFGLLNEFFIREAHAGLDDQGPQGHAKRLCRSIKPLAELGCIVIFQFIPWDQLCQLDPAVVTRAFSAERQEEVFKRELSTMLASVHVENPEQLLGACEAHSHTFYRPKLLISIAPLSIWPSSVGPTYLLVGAMQAHKAGKVRFIDAPIKWRIRRCGIQKQTQSIQNTKARKGRNEDQGRRG
jgi:hypothetical protein